MTHSVTRHRHETRRRNLTVQDKVSITPSMLRITLSGDDLADFVSLGADDHVKLFIAGEMRDYTPRRYDTQARTLTIDFAVHDAGPATRWAVEAQIGDSVEIGGPRGSAVVSPTFDWWLLIGDESALPAIGRRIEELPVGTRAVSIVAVETSQEEQRFETAAEHTAIWVHRPLEKADDPAALLAALQDVVLPESEGFVWIAAEAGVARALRDAVAARGQPSQWTKAAGYWRMGVADGSTKDLEKV